MLYMPPLWFLRVDVLGIDHVIERNAADVYRAIREQRYTAAEIIAKNLVQYLQSRNRGL